MKKYMFHAMNENRNTTEYFFSASKKKEAILKGLDLLRDDLEDLNCPLYEGEDGADILKIRINEIEK